MDNPIAPQGRSHPAFPSMKCLSRTVWNTGGGRPSLQPNYICVEARLRFCAAEAIFLKIPSGSCWRLLPLALMFFASSSCYDFSRCHPSLYSVAIAVSGELGGVRFISLALVYGKLAVAHKPARRGFTRSWLAYITAEVDMRMARARICACTRENGQQHHRSDVCSSSSSSFAVSGGG